MACLLEARPAQAGFAADEEEEAVVGFDDSSDEEDFWALVGCDASSDGEEEARGGDPWPGVDAARCAAALKSEGFVVVTGATGGALAARLGNDVENAAAQSLLRASPNALQTGSGARTIRAKVGVEELELASKGAPVLDDPSVVALRGLCPALRDFGGGAARVLGSRLGAALGGLALRVDEVKAARHGPGGCFPAHFDTTEATGRVVTGILYLADAWGPEDGGELRLYRAGGADAVDVPPRRDTLVLFSSRATLHRTLPLRRGSRPLVSFWFSADGALRLPDAAGRRAPDVEHALVKLLHADDYARSFRDAFPADGAVEAARAAVCKSNLQPDFNVRVFECLDTSTFAVLRELAESNRFVQKSAESTSI